MVNSNILVGVVALVAVIAVFVMISSESAITGYAIDPFKESRAGEYCYNMFDGWMENHPMATAQEQMDYVRTCTMQLME